MARDSLELPPADKNFTVEVGKTRAYARLAYWFEPLNWTLTDIHVPMTYQGQGVGSKLLRMVTSYADEEGIDIRLNVQPGGGWMNYEELVQWYNRHGFVWEDSIMTRHHGTGERMTNHDDTIRNYLNAQKDPQLLVDHTKVDALKKGLADIQDPVERVKVVSEIERLSEPETENAREAFIEHVAAWAEENGVTANALLEEGASADDLQEAGLIRGPAPQSNGKANGKERKRTPQRGTQKDVIQHIKRTRKPFTAPQIVQATKVSRSTAAAAINKLLEEGVVKDTGEEEASARGRAAKVYVYDRD